MKRMILLVLCAMVTDGVVAEPPTLESVAVTPAARALSVGQTQRYTATGTFSDGSARSLGPDIADIAPGINETCVLLTSREVKCWGYNGFGQLGNGSTKDSLAPVRVTGVTKATALASRSGHSCVVLSGGEVKCWGWNQVGQLGNGTTLDSDVPVAATGLNTATEVAPGDQHTCALLASGAVECWGYNASGQLGNGTTADSTVPVTVTGISSATSVAAGDQHSCALVGGAVQCWGWNASGQLGNGDTTDARAPVNVVGINSAKAIAIGGEFSCALLVSGAIKCWGRGGYGELGNGSFAQSSVPVWVAGISTAVAITAGENHACAVTSSGVPQCWGWNEFGQLGTGSATIWASNTPVRVSGVKTPVRLAAGLHHTCALLSDGAMRCWGMNDSGQLGNRRRTGESPNPWPVNVIGTPGVIWRSSDRSKATVGSHGWATGRAAGNTTITATTAGFINDNAVLTVK